MTTLQLNLSPEEAASDASIRSAVARELRLAPEAITSVQIRRRNIDARQRRIRVGLSVEVYLEGEQPVTDDFSDLVYPDVSAAPSVVVVGAAAGRPAAAAPTTRGRAQTARSKSSASMLLSAAEPPM